MTVLQLAQQYCSAGISVIPLRLDGSKEPASDKLPQVSRLSDRKQSGTWKSYQYRIAEPYELEKWFADEQCGIGMVAGAISGGLEIFDFDDGSLFQPWRAKVKTIVDRLPVVETPSGGWHVLFRCNKICGSSKIAKDPSKADKKTLIETRGEGGYVVAEGSPCKTHPTGLPYCQYSGPYLPTIPRITPSERAALWAAARTFDKQPAAVRERILRAKSGVILPANASRPEHPLVADFIRNTTWSQVLEPHRCAVVTVA